MLGNAIEEHIKWQRRLESAIKSNAIDAGTKNKIMYNFSLLDSFLHNDVSGVTRESQQYLRTVGVYLEFSHELNIILDDAVNDIYEISYAQFQENHKFIMLSDKLLISLNEWNSSLEYRAYS